MKELIKYSSKKLTVPQYAQFDKYSRVITGLPFQVPKKEDPFKWERIGKLRYKIELENSNIIIELPKKFNIDNLAFDVVQVEAETSLIYAKLIGFVFYVLLP